MKKYIVLFLILSFSPVFGQTLNIRLTGVLQDSLARIDISGQRFLVPHNQNVEIFTGPYTIGFSAAKDSSGNYDIAAEFFGLGPDYHHATYNLKIAVSDSLPIPAQPVRDNESVVYMVTLLDDTSSVPTVEEALDDTTAWAFTETVHYRTHWLKGSYADFLWPIKMGFLENVYNRYRGSFQLSSFDKIDYYMHPDAHAAVYLDPRLNYSIQPRKRQIDLVFGHDIDVATPRLAAELLLYRMWGYGPRWMVTGFAGFYEDNILQLRKFVAELKPELFVSRFSDEAWVDTDSGRIVTGAFCRWLADIHNFPNFKNLYEHTTALNFQRQFENVYGQSLEKCAAEFIDFVKSYKPKQNELEYYASEYLGRGNYERAGEYYQEAFAEYGTKSGFNIRPYAVCQYWLGDYDKAAKLLKPSSKSPKPEDIYFRADMDLARGKTEQAIRSYNKLYFDSQFDQAGLQLVSIYLDRGEIKDCSAILDSLSGSMQANSDYQLAVGRLKIARGLPADTALATAVAIALGQAQTIPNEPVNYLLAGQAFLLMRKFDKAREYLEIASFLEKRPYFQGCIYLELGKLADLQDQPDNAKDYYEHVLELKSGEYQKSQAKLYLKKKYEL
jgi:tetratricopeptide (TPR) repeat protein